MNTTEHIEQLEKVGAASAVNPTTDAREDEPFRKNKPKRTLGLKLFDDFAYGGLLNTTVFVASTFMTYWTRHGETFGKEGSRIRGVAVWFHQRSGPINKFFGRMGIKSESLRKDLTSVLWSFTDGTIFSFLAKPLENHREQIAKKIDDTLGTTPENMRAYEAEPKQSWGSVIGGRLLTSVIVVPTALLMNKIGGNQRAFLEPGRKFATKVEQVFPKVGKLLERNTIRTTQEKGDFFGFAFFEGFYTSVCTLGMYISSRFIARRHPAKEKQPRERQTIPRDAQTATSEADDAPALEAAAPTNQPTPHITKLAHHERMSEPEIAAGVTA